MTVDQVKHEQDFAEAKKFHGKDVNPYQDDFINKLSKKDNSRQKKAVDDYISKFDENTADVEKRRASYSDLVNNFYDLVTDFYEYGWGQSFHFCRFFKGEEFNRAIARHEHYLSAQLGLASGMKCLDVGCGVGGPMREIARFSGADIVGINNNAYQVDRVGMYNTKAGLPNCKAVKGDFMQMPFESESFDAVYAIEATVHAPTLEGVFSEIFRVLKPGGCFASYEWCCTDTYDETDPSQKRVISAIEEGNGISKMYTIKAALAALKSVGFEVLTSEDLAIFDPRYEEPWYSTLQGSMSLSGFRMSRLGRACTDTMVYALESAKLAPEGSRRVSQLLNMAADYLVEGGERNLFTPMFFYVVRKPLSATTEQ